MLLTTFTVLLATSQSGPPQLEAGRMIAYERNKPVPRSTLTDLGPPEALGGQTLEGNPHIFVRVDYSNNGLTGGIFEASAGKAIVYYPFTEHATIISGEATLTDESGLSKTYKAGDSYLIKQGSAIIWDVKKSVQKSFLNLVE